MKSIYHGTAAANCKLRGKKNKLLSCYCCVLINVKQRIFDLEVKKEIRQFIKERDDDSVYRSSGMEEG